jgi:serine/threonine-protein kinase
MTDDTSPTTPGPSSGSDSDSTAAPDRSEGGGDTISALQEALGSEFEVKRELGSGVMAHVYLATETGLNRPVALKVLRRGRASDETSRKRFEREARASASLSHPKVVQVYRFGRLPDETPYLVMRYVKGRTMEERLAAEGRLDLKTGRQVLAEVASALAAAHRNGIIHRDVRAANVLWDDEANEALLSDFGIAAIQEPSGEDAVRLTQTGQMVGTPQYMSPEQLEERELTTQADIYAFGLLGYELLAGEGPYGARTNVDWITAHLSRDPRPLQDLRSGVDADLANLLGRCLNKDPKRRPTAEDIVRMLGVSPGAGPAAAGGVGSGAPGAGAGFSSDDPVDLQELVKRRVPQIVLIALGLGWGMMTLMDQLVDRGILGDVFYELTLPFVAAGVAVSTVIAWFHGEKGKQSSSLLEWVLVSVIVMVWLAVSAWILIAG